MADKPSTHTAGKPSRLLAGKPSRVPAGEPRLRRVNLEQKSVRNSVEQWEGQLSKSQAQTPFLARDSIHQY